VIIEIRITLCLTSIYSLTMNFRNNDGYKCYKDLKDFKSSFSVFNLNYYELRKNSQRQEYLNLLDFPSIKRWRFQKILIKNIFNTITSSLAYLEHVKQKVKGNTRLRNLIKDDIEICCFFRSLRNYLVHKNTFTLISIQSTKGTSTGSVYHSFDTEMFAEYLKSRETNFDDIALNFLVNLPKRVNFFELLEGLKVWVNSVHKTLIIEFVKIHYQCLHTLINRVDRTFEQHNFFYPINNVQVRYINILLKIAKPSN